MFVKAQLRWDDYGDICIHAKVAMIGDAAVTIGSTHWRAIDCPTIAVLPSCLAMYIARHRRHVFLALMAALAAGILWASCHLVEKKLHALPSGFEQFSIYAPPPACGRWKEHMPTTRSPKAYRIYIEARKVWSSKIGWQLTRAETTRILADVREAAGLGDWGARALLAHFYLYGLGVLDTNHVLDPMPEKAVEIQRMAAKELQPWALYDLGVTYENGYGGAPHDPDLAWAYFLKAAQLGSPEAQMALASAYANERRFDDEKAMLQCAYQQGHGPAAYLLAIKAGIEKRYQEAVSICQEGVKFGSSECARDLKIMFHRGYWDRKSNDEKDILMGLGIGIDTERSNRYNASLDALQINPDLKFSRLDLVLPLPPAQLPVWSGIEDAVEPAPNGPPIY